MIVQQARGLTLSGKSASMEDMQENLSRGQGAMPATTTVSQDRKMECESCPRRGLPMGKSLLTFLLLVMVGLTTTFLVLWVNVKRELSSAQTTQPLTSDDQNQAQKYSLPASKIMISKLQLPAPRLFGQMSVEAALQSRRSRRTFAPTPVSLANLGQILWSMQGLTDDQGHRAAPSARSLYPYTLYVVVRNVAGLEPGFYQYLPETNQLGDLQLANAGELLSAADVQEGAQTAPVVILETAALGKVSESFPDDPESVINLEGGHIAQNAYLQAEALNMSMVVMAGFDPVKVGQVLKLDPAELVVYLVPVGNRSLEPDPAE